MKRIFAFDPGTSALGWAVVEIDGGSWTIKACGVRLYALARQRIVQSMKQRLKPEAREKSRQRRLARLRHLQKLLTAAGLAEPGCGEPWKRQDGEMLRGWIASSLACPLPKQGLVRVLFNVHRHRGSETYGPESESPRQYLAALLAFQSRWHTGLNDNALRQDLEAAVFFRRKSGRVPELTKRGSPLAAMAFQEFKTVWHALTDAHGPADEAAFEAPVPASRQTIPTQIVSEEVSKILEQAGHAQTPRRLLRAKLYLRQSGPDASMAACALTGERFTIATAFSSSIEIDHRIPKVRGGEGGRHNLQLSYASANRTKGGGIGPVSARAKAADKRVSVTDADALRQIVRLSHAFVQDHGYRTEATLFAVGRIAALRHQLFRCCDSKSRCDLKHHAVDALLVALLAVENSVSSIAQPITTAEKRTRLDDALPACLLSSRTEHSIKGSMHEATRYGLRQPCGSSAEAPSITSRKAVDALTKPMLGKIADSALRQRAVTLDLADGVAVRRIFGRTRRVKIVQPGGEAIALRGPDGQFTAAVLSADNHHMDIVQMPDGVWRSFAVTRHQRAQPGWRPLWEAKRLGGKLVMRLHKADLIEWLTETGAREILIVARISGSSGVVHFSRPFSDTGHGGLIAAATRTLQKRQARALDTDAAGNRGYRRSNCA